MAWCPVGFVTVDSVYSRLIEAIAVSVNVTGHFAVEVGAPRYGPDWLIARYSAAEGIKQETWATIRGNLTAKELFPDWGIWSLLRSRALDAYLCSPSGAILKASKLFFYGPGCLDFEEFVLPLEAGSQLEELVDEVTAAEKRGNYDRWTADDGFFVEPGTWVVRTTPAVRASALREGVRRVRKSAYEFQLLREATIEVGGQALAEHWTWLPDEHEDSLWDDISELWSPFAAFSGWSVCFREQDIPSGNPPRFNGAQK